MVERAHRQRRQRVTWRHCKRLRERICERSHNTKRVRVSICDRQRDGICVQQRVVDGDGVRVKFLEWLLHRNADALRLVFAERVQVAERIRVRISVRVSDGVATGHSFVKLLLLCNSHAFGHADIKPVLHHVN